LLLLGGEGVLLLVLVSKLVLLLVMMMLLWMGIDRACSRCSSTSGRSSSGRCRSRCYCCSSDGRCGKGR
jgi:hypothetical protein